MENRAFGPAWRRSSRCGNVACVEVARSGQSILVRDSKDPHGPRLEFGGPVWHAFVSDIKNDEYGEPARF